MRDIKDLTKLQRDIAIMLSEGYSGRQIGEALNCNHDYAHQLKFRSKEFCLYVDQLTIKRKDAIEAETLRILQREIRRKSEAGQAGSKKDLLDWVKAYIDFKKQAKEGTKVGVWVSNVIGGQTDSTSDFEDLDRIEQKLLDRREQIRSRSDRK